MRCGWILFAWALTASPLAAAPKPPAYPAAEEHFNSAYSLRERVIAQVLLIAAGNQNTVPTERFTLNSFNAARDFQSANGLPATGTVDKATFDRLFGVTRPMFDLWNFKVVAHPTRGRPIWMPQGMSLRDFPNKNGLTYRDASGRFSVGYNYLPGMTPEFVYTETLNKMRADETVVHYSVIKDGWFVISATTRSGTDEYLRYHQDGDGILGFVAFWNNAKGDVHGERIAVLMSASLGSVMNGRPFISPPPYPEAPPARVAEVPPTIPLTRPDPGGDVAVPRAAPPAPSPPPAAMPAVPEDKGSTGTGFFIDDRGHLITNAHVVKVCSAIVVKTPDGQTRKAELATTDTANDIALLRVPGLSGNKFATLRYSVRLGESVATYGYPHIEVLANSGNFTLGNITALAGVNDDSRFYQISAPVQAGNSGGPLLDNYGNVGGIIASKLNARKFANASGEIPQNVNFAIKGAILGSFLESNGVTVTPGTTTVQKLDPADLAETAREISALVICQ